MLKIHPYFKFPRIRAHAGGVNYTPKQLAAFYGLPTSASHAARASSALQTWHRLGSLWCLAHSSQPPPLPAALHSAHCARSQLCSQICVPWPGSLHRWHSALRTRCASHSISPPVPRILHRLQYARTLPSSHWLVRGTVGGFSTWPLNRRAGSEHG